MIQYVVAVAVGALLGSMDKSKPKKRKKFEDGGKTGDKPKVISISESLMKMDGEVVQWEDMDNAIIMWGRPMDAEDVYNALARKEIYLDEYAPELFVMKEDEDDEEPVELKSDVTIDDIVDAIEDERFMKADNTYNYNAPFVFDYRYVETDDPYDEQLYFVREHRGGDVRGNYGNYMAVQMDSVEESPLYGRILVYLQTDKGDVTLDSDSIEGYNYEVIRDETGTLEEYGNVSADDIEEAFDFGKLKSDALNIFAHGGVVGDKLSPAEMQKLILDKTGELLDPDTQKFADVAGAMGYAYALFGGYWTKSFAHGGRVLTAEEWASIKPFNKHISRDGQRYIAKLDEEKGTMLVPVIVMDKEGRKMADGGRVRDKDKHIEKVAERSIRKMDSDDQLSSLREYAQHDMRQKFAERDKALKKAYEDKATFDLPTPRYYTSEFAHGGIAHTDSLHQEIRDFLMSQGMNPKNYAILEGDRRLTKPFEWVDLHSGKSRGGFATEADALQALKKFLQERYGLLTSMAHGGQTERLKKALDVYDDLLKRFGITDDDVFVSEGYGEISWSDALNGKMSKGFFKSPETAYEDVNRYLRREYGQGKKMAHGGQVPDYLIDVLYSQTTLTKSALQKFVKDNHFSKDDVLSIVSGIGRGQIEPMDVEMAVFEGIGSSENEELVKFAKSGKAFDLARGGKTHRQGYDDKLDESLAMRRGAGRTKEQGRKDRRDESAGMEKSMGRRKYASVGTMDKGSREMAKGGTITAPQPILDGKEFIALVVDKDGMPQMKFSKTFNGALRMAKNMTKKFGTGEYAVKKFDPFYGASFFDEGLFIEPTKSFDKGGKTKKRKEVSDFDKLAMKVAARYRAEGKSNKKAMEIGRGTAAKVYRQQQRKKGK